MKATGIPPALHNRRGRVGGGLVLAGGGDTGGQEGTEGTPVPARGWGEGEGRGGR